MSQWLMWAKRLQALSQAGQTFTKDEYDRERYLEIQQIATEMFEQQSNLALHERTELIHVDGYPTPKLDVRGVVFREDRLLLVKERSDGLWTLPGGFCEVGLSPAENIVKEIEEESGFDVAPIRLVALFDMHHHPHPPLSQHYYKLFIECEVIGGEAQVSQETSDVGFFGRDDLPPLSLARNTLEQLHMCFEARWQDDWVTLFD
ncbi:NUDIX hydrolase [Exiguobacterium sp.]|uniref:NUDIX hydrolase n=1 Tax=Exiguobacterium sp. TaxID=44751 RepID=UPI00263AE297|nr:NUDIX hydrolase [Exiguobacterium sp.]MCC5892073.1 NUDIX hydrolase [Exiguobacterium sp.]